MEDKQPVENEPTIEELYVELTPEQEAESLYQEFINFAKELETGLSFISQEDDLVVRKVENLSKALRWFTVDEIGILFKALEQAYPQDFTEAQEFTGGNEATEEEM